MAYYGRFSRPFFSLYSFNRCGTISQGSGNVEFAFYSRKVDIPLPPKRPLTAYMIFCRENRNDLLKEFPGLSSPEQIKKLAEKWSQLSIEMKKPYELTAREGTQLYGEAHKNFYENLTDDQKDILSKLKVEKMQSRKLFKLKKALKESGMPKSSASAYTLFVQSQAGSKLDSSKPTDFIKSVSEKWKNLSEKEKKTLEEKAQVDKLRYVTEMQQWNEKLLKEGKIHILKEYGELKKKMKINTKNSELLYSDDEDSYIAPKASPKKPRVSKN